MLSSHQWFGKALCWYGNSTSSLKVSCQQLMCEAAERLTQLVSSEEEDRVVEINGQKKPLKLLFPWMELGKKEGTTRRLV